jgi:hypothetical protein
VPIGRSRARTFAETFICDDDRKNKNTTHFSIVSLSARRTHTRVPARSTRVRTDERTPRDRSVAPTSHHRARRLRARVFTTTIRLLKKKYETPSAVSLAERSRPRARARTVKAIFDDEL